MGRGGYSKLENALVISHNENPGWLEIAIDAAPELNDPLGAFFFDLGATGLVWEDFGNRTLKAYLPLKESPETIQNRISIYLNNLSSIHPHLPSPDFKLTKMENQDWQRNWRQFFRPIQISPKLMILPIWEELPSHTEEAHIIRIDPGPAFGTGQHATTKMCLQAMESLVSHESQALLDVGTGSGILAIYGAQLGFGKIEAIDVDPEAVRWAERNIGLNDVANAITLSGTEIEEIRDCFSLVCANLILSELLRLMPALSRLVETDGHLVASGILRDQVEKIQEALPVTGFFTSHLLYEDEWACMILRKSGE
ncbi:MAG: ribosomal protein L11 methyltransferase [Desulfobacteraceae bacterium 4572_87]|nr:MAG: ribosomal protein L11 methyltransferase [Desulfobacteraceae bacterium 4572_87]